MRDHILKRGGIGQGRPEGRARAQRMVLSWLQAAGPLLSGRTWLLGIGWMLLSWGPLLSAQASCGSVGPAPVPELGGDSSFPKRVLTIPVVFHVLYSRAADSISLEQIHSQLDVLNADFRAQNSDLTDVIPPHRARVADMEINFVLADQRSDGRPASGVIYREVPAGLGEDFVGDRRAVCYEELGGSDAWCTPCYLNVWVVRNRFFAGKAIFPTEVGNTVPRAEDGIYINPDRIGTLGSVTAPYDRGRTLTHEVGHYLNLYHLWGPNPVDPDCDFSCCDGTFYDDGVDDTPEQWRTYLGECPTGAPNSCFDGPPDSPDNYQNFMTFADDACLLMFTAGQKARVRQSLQQYRPGLLAANCEDQCVTAAVAVPAFPGKAWISQSALWTTEVPAGAILQWRTLTGQLLLTCVNAGPELQQYVLPPAPAGVYVLVWHWKGQTGSKLLFWP